MNIVRLDSSRLILVGIAFSVVSAGCITPYDPTRVNVADPGPDTALIEEKIRRLEGDTESAILQVNDLRREVERAHETTNSAVERGVETLTRNLESLQQRVTALERAREQDKQEIVDRLSAKISELMSQGAAAGSAAVRRSARRTSEYGYEHTVESGQTLSAIAQAYGVSSHAIMEANNLSDPNRLQVGQKLFIPE